MKSKYIYYCVIAIFLLANLIIFGIEKQTIELLISGMVAGFSFAQIRGRT